MKKFTLGLICALSAGSTHAADTWCTRSEVNRVTSSSVVSGQTRIVLLTTERETCVSLPAPASAYAGKDLAYLGLSATKIVDATRLSAIPIGPGGRIDPGVLAGIRIAGSQRIEPGLLDYFLQLLARLQPRLDPGLLPLMALGGELEVSVRYVTRLEAL